MATISNIKNIQSVSSENVSMVILEFEQTANMDSVTIEKRESLDQISASWSDSIGSPVIMKLNPDMMPIMIAAVNRDGMDSLELTDYVNNELLAQMESIEGVASVSMTGGIEETLQVVLTESKIEEKNQEVRDALDRQFADARKELTDARDQIEDGLAQGLIEYVGEDCINALYAAIEARSIRPGICKTAGLKLVYSPLNGSGLVPVTHVLGDIGITDITIVPEQKDPDGNFPTCPYPNPEIFEALRLGLELAEKSGADLMLATDPDADRVGIAVKCKDGSYELLSGNEVGVLLLDYICAGRIEQGTMPKNPVMCKSIVSTPLADKVAEHYGVECRNVLTGFKWIGDQIAKLEADGEVDRFIFGFEESYGYLAGPYVRDKDAIIGSMLICEMAAYYRAKGSSIKEELERIYTEYGRYLNKVDSFEFPGLSGMDKMADIMQNLRDNPPKDFAGDKVVKVVDYKKPEETGLPAANVLIYTLESGATVVVRPSGTEPKIKTYFTTKGKDLAEAEAQKEKLAEACKPLLA